MSILQDFKCLFGFHKWDIFRHVRGDKCIEETKCIYCSRKKMEIIHDHDWKDWKTQPSICVDMRSCKQCGKLEERTAEHIWGEWELVPGKCEENKVCQRCGNQEKRTAVHLWGKWIQVSDDCVEYRCCDRCGQNEKRKSEHLWGEWAASSNSCTESHQCLRCKTTSYETRHEMSEWKKSRVNYKQEATCNKCGRVQERVSYQSGVCPECGAGLDKLWRSSVSPYIEDYYCPNCSWSAPKCGSSGCGGFMIGTPTGAGTYVWRCILCGWNGEGMPFVKKSPIKG